MDEMTRTEIDRLDRALARTAKDTTLAHSLIDALFRALMDAGALTPAALAAPVDGLAKAAIKQDIASDSFGMGVITRLQAEIARRG